MTQRMAIWWMGGQVTEGAGAQGRREGCATREGRHVQPSCPGWMSVGRMRFRLGCSPALGGAVRAAAGAGAGAAGAGAGGGGVTTGVTTGGAVGMGAAGTGAAPLGRRRGASSGRVPARARAMSAMTGGCSAAGRTAPSSPGANERTLQKPSRLATRTCWPSGVHARSVIAARCRRRAAATACHACVSYTTTASSDATANTIRYGSGTAALLPLASAAGGVSRRR